MEQIFLVSFVILLLSSSIKASPDCYIEINKPETSATSTTITWETSKQCELSNIERYEVFWEHVKYMACIEGLKDTAAYGSKEVIVTKIIISDLKPFSIYDIKIKTTTHDGSTIEQAKSTFETKMDVPDTRPRLSPTSDRYEHAIKFIWLDPDPSECIHQNGRRDGYQVELLGRDPWESDIIKIGDNKTVDTYFAENLKPYTSYLLRVYNKNIGNLVNQIPLEIQERTRETHPLPPTNLTAKASSQHSVHISWNPSYPPTGLTEKYELGIGEIYDSESNFPIWKNSVQVGLTHQGACIGEKKQRSTTLSNSFCYVFNGLKAGLHYAFRIKAWNKNVNQPSKWSEITDVWTQMPDIITPITTPTPATPATTSQPSIGFTNTTIITVLCLAAGIVLMGVIVTALVYKLKIIRLKQQIRNEETWNQNRTISQSSSYLPGASTTSTQMTDTYLASLQSQTPSEIQRRRLPEPPPLKNRIKPNDPSYAEAYELASLPTSYLDMTSSRRASANSPSQLESTRIQEEENTDMEGYLRPTFPIPDFTPIRPGTGYNDRHRNSSQTDSDYVSESQDVPSLITPESYVSPDTIRNEIPPPYLITDSRLLSSQVECDRISPGRRSQNSIHFDRAGRLSSHRSETSGASSNRTSPSEPLISISISKAVDV
eukprot:GFUD01069231.1.p1 GENE.GFUD01069231.1~~GFUD01069231.1.p1  ORF type:complete len:658 (-),score=71.81 GFUD01069231.1:387-2360(-)